ncbi:hypothetical protein HCN44_004763 [Aphidius gifuensis]|uniref:Myotubularin phosphatase domain-containing protein n=1 Tax=Aphidius gifuensis TaxID=684658 RepID=A0A835CL66_APHGI|nr:hypothetical protein HCN44_004763 [Aphidius gifuensis]
MKVRLQTSPIPKPGESPLCKGTWDCAKKTVAKEGFRSLYEGMGAPLTGVAPVFAISFLSYGLVVYLQQVYWHLVKESNVYYNQRSCGLNGKRCQEDERLLNSVLGAGRRGYIIDTRTLNQAQNSKTKNSGGGGGTEIDLAYAQWRKVYKNVPRNAELNDSLCKLIEACNDCCSSTGQWLWLNAAQTVLVHGNSERDSTLIVISLAQIILNPNCRTIHGLQSSLKREWLQAGHPFFTRTRHSAYYQSNQNNSSPTFLLFLDCLYQLH